MQRMCVNRYFKIILNNRLVMLPNYQNFNRAQKSPRQPLLAAEIEEM